ncbi:MAG: hypothetical protein WAM53_21045 [Terrimicrobiaceae bacterium]
MARLILRFTGPGEVRDEDLARIGALPAAKIIDRSPRMLLVEAPPDKITQLLHDLPNWTLSPETFIATPDPRPKPKKP